MFCLSWYIHGFFQDGWRLLYFLPFVRSNTITIISKRFKEGKKQFFIAIILWLRFISIWNFVLEDSLRLQTTNYMPKMKT